MSTTKQMEIQLCTIPGSPFTPVEECRIQIPENQSQTQNPDNQEAPSTRSVPSDQCRIQIPETKPDPVVDSKGQGNNIQTWDDFIQNTTIHGVKYIFDNEHLKLRR